MGDRGNSHVQEIRGDDAFRRLAERVRAQGVRVDTRLAILSMLGSEDENELSAELDTMLEEVEARARDFAQELRRS